MVFLDTHTLNTHQRKNIKSLCLIPLLRKLILPQTLDSQDRCLLLSTHASNPPLAANPDSSAPSFLEQISRSIAHAIKKSRDYEL